MIAHSRDKNASTPQNPACPGELGCQDRKPDWDYDDGWARKYDHHCAEEEDGETDHTDHNFARDRHAVETKARS
jgi:hypothetical protein